MNGNELDRRELEAIRGSNALGNTGALGKHGRRLVSLSLRFRRYERPHEPDETVVDLLRKSYCCLSVEVTLDRGDGRKDRKVVNTRMVLEPTYRSFPRCLTSRSDLSDTAT